MLLIKMLEISAIYGLIYILSEVLSENLQPNQLIDKDMPQDSEIIQKKKVGILTAVYDSMKYNLELNMRNNMNKLNLLHEVRGKRNTNEPMINAIPEKSNMLYEKPLNNMFDQRKLFYNAPAKLQQNHRSDYGYDDHEYTVKCEEAKPAVSYSIEHGSEHGGGKQGKDLQSIITTLKYAFGGLLLLSLPFLFLKLVVFPLKLFLGLKAIAFANTLLFGTFVFRYLTRLGSGSRNPVLNSHNGLNNGGLFDGFGNLKSKKWASIKQILNERDDDESDDETLADNIENRINYSRLSNDSSSNGVTDDLQNLLKLIKLKNKNW